LHAPPTQEEAKWLIDVATSLLRLAYRQVGPMFPMPGDIEPNPTLPWHLKDVSATIGKDSTTGRTHGIIKSYEIDRQLEPAITDPAFLTRANLIFDPPVGSVAGRIHNGLGWLTRGRQSDDRAERFLFTFTAIESLLSNSDKTAPITQTIARHAAVILTDDTAARQKIASSISGLYDFRSTVVHRGGRPVAWTQVKRLWCKRWRPSQAGAGTRRRSSGEGRIPNLRCGFVFDAKLAEFELTLPDPGHEFDAGDRRRCSTETLEAEHWTEQQLDRSVILFDPIIQIF
jgi:Apea-like HEPN